MNIDQAPFYGALVFTPHDENHSGIPDEELVMKEQTRMMIEEAAYFLAHERGFAPGYELQDWLQAEVQITTS